MLRTLPDEIIDLTVTSPPYNVGKQYDQWNDIQSTADYEKLIRTTIMHLYRITKKGGRLCLNVPLMGNSWFKQKTDGLIFYPSTYMHICESNDWILREFLVWHKCSERNIFNIGGDSTAWGSWLSPKSPYCRCFTEVILVYHKETSELQHNGESDLTKLEFMEYTRSSWFFYPENRFLDEHPAPFPEELPKRCIKLYTFIGDVVLDPFCGTGTTCLVASKLNRRYIGIDISQKYCNISKSRLSAVQMDLL